jgi:hypothetical protein
LEIGWEGYLVETNRKDIPQQFLADCILKYDVDLPNSLMDVGFLKKISEMNYELPSEQFFDEYLSALNNRFPSRNIIPIAKSCSSDQTVGIIISSSEATTGQIIQFQDFSSEGWDGAVYFNSLTDWIVSEKQNYN